MSYSAKFIDANFTGALRGMVLPDREGLVAEFRLGVNEAESVMNRANPSLPLTVQGAPVYNADHVVVRSNAATGYGFIFPLAHAPTDDATLFFVRTNATGVTTVHYAGIGAPTWLGFRSFAANYGSNGEPANGSGATRPAPPAGTIFAEALVLSRENKQLATGGYGKLYWLDAGGALQVAVSAQKNTSIGRSTFATVPMAIGSTRLTEATNNAVQTNKAYFWGQYDRTLSDAGILAALLSIRSYYAGRNVVVV
jgi:hypothetical protein